MRWTGLLLVVAVGTASANGRPPGTSTIHFRQQHEQDIVAGTTFGAVISHDGGATWQWFCEDAIGYGGMYDPFYGYTRSGKLFATTFHGLKVNLDGCVFEDSALGQKFASSLVLGPDGALYVGMTDPSDGAIHASTDDGVTFPAMTMPGQINDWWQSIAVAPSDPRRMYLTGYRFIPRGDNDTTIDHNAPVDGTPYKEHLLFASSDAGASWQPFPRGAIEVTPLSSISIAAVAPRDPARVFARVSNAHGITGDAIYRSGDAGQTWVRILDERDKIAFLARANGDLVAATPTLGAQVSHDLGDTWVPLVNPPHVGCLVENAAGEVWACTANYDQKNGAPIDGFGIMKSMDLATWTGVLRDQAITGPVACALGTVQHDTCEKKGWCGTRTQLSIGPDPTTCNAMEVPVQIAPGPPTPSGCCDAGAHPDGLAIAGAVGMILGRRRRRCSALSIASPTARSTSRSS